MKKALLDRQTRKLLRENRTARRSTPTESVRRIGILYTAVDAARRSEILRFSQELAQQSIQVRMLEFRAKPAASAEETDICTEKDISFWGRLRNADALQFMDEPFDYLFVAESEGHPVVRHILAGSKAKCRAGLSCPELNPYLDLMVSMQGPWSEILKALKDVTRKLN